jgi:hypothetical protein
VAASCRRAHVDLLRSRRSGEGRATRSRLRRLRPPCQGVSRTGDGHAKTTRRPPERQAKLVRRHLSREDLSRPRPHPAPCEPRSRSPSRGLLADALHIPSPRAWEGSSSSCAGSSRSEPSQVGFSQTPTSLPLSLVNGPAASRSTARAVARPDRASRGRRRSAGTGTRPPGELQRNPLRSRGPADGAANANRA